MNNQTEKSSEVTIESVTNSSSTNKDSRQYPQKSYSFIAYFMLFCVVALAASSTYFLLAPEDTGKKKTNFFAPTDGNGAIPSMDASDPLTQKLSMLMEQIKADPQNVMLHLDIAEIFLENGSAQLAKNFIDRALQLEPKNTTTLIILGKYFFSVNEEAKAAQAFEQVLAQEQNPAAMLNLGIVYKYYLQKPQEAKKLFESILDVPTADMSIKEAAFAELSRPNP